MRLMVLGGGSCQMNLIKRAKHRGHEIILVDYLHDCPGRALADVHLPISTFDTESVTRYAEQYNIEGIVTAGTDQPVLTAAVVSERLGLNFYIDSSTALAVTNKRVMKKLFTRFGIPSAAYRLTGRGFSDDEIAGLTFPAVLKPVDSQGQRGIFLVESADEAKRRIGETLKFSREYKALLEEFYENDEITVNGWAHDGAVTIISVVDRVTIKRTRHIGVCLCHNYPSVYLKEYYEQIKVLTENIVRSFGIKNGPVYFQYLIGNEGIKVNEIAMRTGGAYEDLTIPVISGIDIMGMLLDCIETGSCDTETLAGYDMLRVGKFLSTQLFFCRPGKVRSITPEDEMKKLTGVIDIGYNYSGGSVIPGIENATARAGYMLVEGRSFADMIGNVNNAFEHLKILDESGTNLVIKYKDYDDKYLFGKEHSDNGGGV